MARCVCWVRAFSQTERHLESALQERGRPKLQHLLVQRAVFADLAPLDAVPPSKGLLFGLGSCTRAGDACWAKALSQTDSLSCSALQSVPRQQHLLVQGAVCAVLAAEAAHKAPHLSPTPRLQ